MQKRKDITGLIRMLSHPESEIRRVAILALGDFGDERAIDGLISVLSKDTISASVARESLIRIGTVSEEPLIAVINRASTPDEASHSFVLSGEKGVPVFALEILGKIGGVSAIRPIINLASTNINYSNRALETLKHILERHIVDISVEDLKLISTIHGIVGVIGEQPFRGGNADDDWLTEPMYGLLELKLQMPELRQIAMQELKRRNIEMTP